MQQEQVRGVLCNMKGLLDKTVAHNMYLHSVHTFLPVHALALNQQG